MKILYYSWNENSAQDIMDTFQTLSIDYKKIDFSFESYDEDVVFEQQFQQELDREKFDAIYTFDYFPIISDIAQENQIKYISWVYDCPHTTLYSKTITNPCNYIFIFDRQLFQKVQAMGAVHVYHMPLAVNTTRIDNILRLDVASHSEFLYDVSFVGGLYEQNLYDQIRELPDYVKGYILAIMNAQQKIWGYNFIEEMLTPNIVKQLDTYVKLEDNPNYQWTHQMLYADMINQKITSMDRITYLEQVTNFFSLDLFTGSNTDACPKAKKHGFISYTEQMPQVFCQSKINLNISLRSITSGIPLRCLDIMGAGGFLLTNYQPELCEYFQEGVDFVYYEDAKDMLHKIDYFLCNEAERKAIAANGYEKVKNNFGYEKVVEEMLEKCYTPIFDS